MPLRRNKSRHFESSRALSDAQENLHKIRARTPEVRRVANNMRETLARNHFAEQLKTIMIRGDDVE